jgi:hypothetical protein
MVYKVGIYSKGKYDAKSNCYRTWKNMLQRCYDEKLHGRYPTYKGCKVSDEWIYFENFVKWYDQNYIDGYQLDKDILGDGKLYSKDTCCFLPNKINSFLHKNIGRNNDLPTGVRKEGNRYRAVLNIGVNKKRHIGYYSEPNEAKKAYDKEKNNYLLQVLNDYAIAENIKSILLNKL